MTLFVILHVVICLFLVGVILLQPGKSDGGIGFGSSSQSIFGSRGAGNFLTKTTSVCAVLFLLTSFVLTRSRIQETQMSVLNRVPEPTAPIAPPPNKAPEAGKAPEPTKAPEKK